MFTEREQAIIVITVRRPAAGTTTKTHKKTHNFGANEATSGISVMDKAGGRVPTVAQRVVCLAAALRSMGFNPSIACVQGGFSL